MKHNQGFTLIELLVVIGVITILAAIVLVAINPARNFAQARDTERRSELYALTSAIYQFAAEHEGRLPDTDGDVTTSNFPVTPTCVGITPPCFDLGAAGEGTTTIVPTYIPEIPTDPTTGDSGDTGYQIWEDANGRVVASASGEIVGSIAVTR